MEIIFDRHDMTSDILTLCPYTALLGYLLNPRWNNWLELLILMSLHCSINGNLYLSFVCFAYHLMYNSMKCKRWMCAFKHKYSTLEGDGMCKGFPRWYAQMVPKILGCSYICLWMFLYHWGCDPRSHHPHGHWGEDHKDFHPLIGCRGHHLLSH